MVHFDVPQIAMWLGLVGSTKNLVVMHLQHINLISVVWAAVFLDFSLRIRHLSLILIYDGKEN